MNRQIRMIACDLDGTLLTPDKRLSPYTVDTLKKVHAAGCTIVLCSGRPFYSIQRIFKDVPFDYACCLNGQSVYDHDGRALMEKPGLTGSEIQDLLALTAEYPVILNYSIGTAFYHTVSPAYTAADKLISWISRIIHPSRRSFIRRFIPFDQVKIDACEKFCYAGTYRTLQKLMKEMDPAVYGAVFVSKNWLEVQPAGVSKGSALAFLEEYTGIPKENCAAIGDGENDLSMFAAAGIRTAMKNGMPALKEKADDIAPLSRKDGAARWMVQNIL